MLTATQALMKDIFPKKHMPPEQLFKAQSFFDFCQAAVLASWIKADDPSFDPCSFVGIPLELALRMASDTSPGGADVWDKHNMLTSVLNLQYTKSFDTPSEKSEYPKGLKAVNAHRNVTVAGRAYGTRNISNSLIDGNSPIYKAFLSSENQEGFVSGIDTVHHSWLVDVRRGLIWSTLIPALVECGWFPRSEHQHFTLFLMEYTKDLGQPKAVDTFLKFEVQARETARVMLAKADEYWMS